MTHVDQAGLPRGTAYLHRGTQAEGCFWRCQQKEWTLSGPAQKVQSSGHCLLSAVAVWHMCAWESELKCERAQRAQGCDDVVKGGTAAHRAARLQAAAAAGCCRLVETVEPGGTAASAARLTGVAALPTDRIASRGRRADLQQ